MVMRYDMQYQADNKCDGDDAQYNFLCFMRIIFVAMCARAFAIAHNQIPGRCQHYARKHKQPRF